MRQRAVDDGVGADVEKLQIDVAEQTPQFEEALRMAQRNMHHLMGDQAQLLGNRQRLEAPPRKKASSPSVATGGAGATDAGDPDASPRARGRRLRARIPPCAGSRGSPRCSPAPRCQAWLRLALPLLGITAVGGAGEDRALKAAGQRLLHQQLHRQRLRLAHRQGRLASNVAELLDDLQRAGDRRLVDAGGEQPVDHAVKAIERLRQQRRGLPAGARRQQAQHVDARLKFAQHAEKFGGVGGADPPLHE